MTTAAQVPNLSGSDVELDDEEQPPKPKAPVTPQLSSADVEIEHPAQPLAPKAPPAQTAVARANIAQYPENQQAPDPAYLQRKASWEAIQGEPAAPPFEEDPEQERRIRAQQTVQSSQSNIPQAVVPALQAIQTHVNEPLERMSRAGAEFGRDAALQSVTSGAGEGTMPMDQAAREQRAQEFTQTNPRIAGTVRAAGSVIGGMVADPRMWPFFLAGPETAPALRAASGYGFSAQMAQGAYEQAGELGKLMGNPDASQEDKWEAGANFVLSAIMAGHGAGSALAGEFQKLPAQDQAEITARIRAKEPDVAAQIDQASKGQQTATPNLTAADVEIDNGKSSQPERFRLPKDTSAAEVQGPVKGPNIRTVQVGDKTYAFDQRKINADGVTSAVERGELWRLSGGKAPEAAKVQAETDLKGEEPTSQNPTVNEEPKPEAAPQFTADQVEHEEPAPAPPPQQETPQQPERRTDTAQRKRVADLTPDERAKELLTSDAVDLPNRRAFDEKQQDQKAPAVSISDADGLKALNDSYGYEAGTALLQAKADALKEAGLDAYHDKGDEFVHRGQSEEELKTKLEQAREILRNRIIRFKDQETGKIRRFKGADFSYGTSAQDLGKATLGLKAHKAEREARGERARGEFRNITEVRPEETEVRGDRAEVTPATHEEVKASASAHPPGIPPDWHVVAPGEEAPNQRVMGDAYRVFNGAGELLSYGDSHNAAINQAIEDEDIHGVPPLSLPPKPEPKPPLEQAFDVWNNGDAYFDNGGNMRLYEEGATALQKKRGAVAPFNKEVKAAFKQYGREAIGEFGKAAKAYKGESVSAKAGEMERESPLFRDSEASGQGGLFGKKDERGSSTSAAMPIPAIIEGAAGVIKKGSDLYHGAVDKLLDKVHMNNTRPEIRQFDPDAADLATKMDAGGQYHKAVAEMIGKKVSGPLSEDFSKSDSYADRQKKNDISRDRMKGFHFLADAQNREWLKENRPDDFNRWSNDPKIKAAIEAYKPFEEQLRQAVKQLGGKTINEDYIKRIMDFTTSGIAFEDKSKLPGQQIREGRAQARNGGGRDNVVSPQMDRSKGRIDEGQYYWDHGVFDFGPSFEKRWVEVMSKLDEHRLAVHAMSMGTRIAPDEESPDKVFYNGQEFYRPDVAREIREVQKRGVSAESKELADALGVSELPAPGKVREYGNYEPLRRGSRFETAARNLAANVLAGKEDLAGQAANLSNMAKLKYALPKEIVEALNDAGREKEQGAFSKMATKVLNPLTQFIRQQIVGLGYGIPHMANIMRKVVQSHTGAALNPMGWADAFKVAFSKELKARGISGTEDPMYNMLLKNAAMSEGAIPEYKHYIEGNLDKDNWKETFGNAFRKGGKAAGEVTPASAVAGVGRLAIEPLNRFSEAGHKNLFQPGGIDQRARIWLGDFLQDRYPKMSENGIANTVNQTLGRYNRASWTDVQKGLGPLMLFPGWDYSSMTYALKHPFKTAVAPALLMLMANSAVRSLGGNKKDEQHDLERVHVGKYSVRANILNDNFGTHIWGWALRGGKAVLDHKNAKDVTGEMVKGVPGDVAGVTTGTLNPILSTPIQVGANRVSPGRQDEISKPGDFHKKGKVLPNKAAEDYADFGARRLFPLYDRATQAGQRPSLASFAGTAGVSVTEKKKKK